MRLLVAGANGGTGRAVLRQALAADHEVTAVARRADRLPEHPRLTVRLLDVVEDVDAVSREAEGHDAIVSTLGNRLMIRHGRAPKILAPAHRTLARAAVHAGVSRVVTMLSYGSAATTAHAPPAVRLLAGTLLRTDFRDLGAADAALTSTALAWTILHFGALTDGPHTGRWHISHRLSRPTRYRISRTDVADALLTAVHTPALERRRAVLSGPSKRDRSR